MSTPAPIPKFAFSHMGMFVADLARMRDFYTRVLGFTVTDSGELDTARGRLQFVFLSRDPKEHHQIVLATGKPDGLPFNPINQISFRMAEFSGLREMYRRVVDELVRIKAAGLNKSEVSNVMGGHPYTTLPRTPGRDFAGVVERGPQALLGRAVWGTGNAIGFTRDGSHAEFIALPADAVALKPE